MCINRTKLESAAKSVGNIAFDAATVMTSGYVAAKCYKSSVDNGADEVTTMVGAVGIYSITNATLHFAKNAITNAILKHKVKKVNKAFEEVFSDESNDYDDSSEEE